MVKLIEIHACGFLDDCNSNYCAYVNINSIESISQSPKGYVVIHMASGDKYYTLDNFEEFALKINNMLINVEQLYPKLSNKINYSNKSSTTYYAAQEVEPSSNKEG